MRTIVVAQVEGAEKPVKKQKPKQKQPVPHGFERSMHDAVNLMCAQTSSGQLAPPPSRKATTYEPEQVKDFWNEGYEAAVHKIKTQFDMPDDLVRDKTRA